MEYSGHRKHRACLLCSLIKTMQEFKAEGCDNCESILRLRGSQERVLECTSGLYDGQIGLYSPEQSWVGRWQRLNHYIPGVYALRVIGVLPEEVQQVLEEKGIPYFPRDQGLGHHQLNE